MAITVSSYTVGSDTGGSATVSVTTAESPATTQVGDVVIVIHSNDFYAFSNMVAPTATGSPTMNAISGGAADGGTNIEHIKSYWYVANTAGAQTISTTETGTHDEEKSLTAIVLALADGGAAIDVAGNATGLSISASSIVVPAISPTTSDAFLIISIAAANANLTYTTPAPLTEQGEYSVGTGNLSGVNATNQLSASGSTGTFTFTTSLPLATQGACAVMIAVRTAAGGSGGSPGSGAFPNMPGF